MAAPAVLDKLFIRFKDAKGDTSRMSLNVGGADHAATVTALNTMVTDAAAVSNAATRSGLDYRPLQTYGTAAVYQSIEDGALLTFVDPVGALHRFKLPAPKSAFFDVDGETVLNTGAMATFIADIAANVYAAGANTSPLVYVGGIRVRRKLHRRINIWTKNPAETGPAE